MSTEKAHLHYAPDYIMDLRRELAMPDHAELLADMQKECKTFEDIVGYLASEFGIVMHGWYSGEALQDVCERLIAKLRTSRVVEVQSPSSCRIPVAPDTDDEPVQQLPLIHVPGKPNTH